MPEKGSPYIAAIYYRNASRIAGTGFAIRDNLLITCAHVVRDALELGQMTAEAPKDKLQVKFRFLKDRADFDAVVVPGGWFPGDSCDLDLREPKDIAILKPCNGSFPVGPELIALSWHGPASCLGFPSSRGGKYRAILGNVELIEETDGWLNMRPANVNEEADLRGMSGAPLCHNYFDGICGMLSGHWLDDELSFRIVPGKTLQEVVAQVKAQAAGRSEAGTLYREDGKDKAARAVLKDWQVSAGNPQAPTAADIAGLCAKLLEEATRHGNQLPENFPFRYVEVRFALLDELTKGKWPPEVEKLGAFVADLAEFMAELSVLPWEMRAQIEACDTAGRKLSAIIAAGGDVLPHIGLKCHDAPWPAGLDTQVRAEAEGVKAAAEPLRGQEDSQVPAAEIDEHASVIRAETFRPRPHWSRMRASANTIVKAAEALKQHGPLPGLSAAASALKQRLCAASGAAISALAPLSRFQELPFAPEMVVIPAGKFLMGSPDDEKDRNKFEGPQQEVTISRPFAVGRYPVTAEEYAYFCAQTGRKAPDIAEGDARHPVARVSWDDAKAYVEWLSSVAGAKYRLLSEAEWEYACRAGTQTRYWFGDEITKDQANFNGNGTTEVGSYPANGFGLYDMHGNVWEWVEDTWHDTLTGVPTDGAVWTWGGRENPHVVRGGSWYGSYSRYLRSAVRDGGGAVNRFYGCGFRLARILRSVVVLATPGAAAEDKVVLPPITGWANIIDEDDRVEAYAVVHDPQDHTGGD